MLSYARGYTVHHAPTGEDVTLPDQCFERIFLWEEMPAGWLTTILLPEEY